MTSAFCASQIILRSTAAPTAASSSSSWVLAWGTYFDSVGHCTWRGSHALNSPLKSWRRASRSSAMICGFCAVNQSCNSSRVSTDESTSTGISIVPMGMRSAYQFRLETQTLLAIRRNCGQLRNAVSPSAGRSSYRVPVIKWLSRLS